MLVRILQVILLSGYTCYATFQITKYSVKEQLASEKV